MKKNRFQPKSKKELLCAVVNPRVYTLGPFAWYGKWRIGKAKGDRFKLISSKRERVFYRIAFGLYIKVNEVRWGRLPK